MNSPIVPPVNRQRRMFLRGAGGAMLALPVLPSLFSSEAAAQAMASQRNFVSLRSPYGGATQREIFPAASTLTDKQNYAGFEIRRGALVPTSANGETRVSNILRAPSSVLNARIVSKMNVVNGVDIPFYIGHNRSQALGNFADSDQADSNVQVGGQRMTIDQIMAWSPSFYRDLSHVRERSINFGTSSWTWSNPARRTGTFQRTGDTAGSNVALFDQLFGTSTTPAKPLVVDQVVESYRRLRDGNARISAADKQRLNDHMERMYELQRKLKASAAVTTPTRPTVDSYALANSPGYSITPDRQAQYQSLYNDIVVAAFSTGSTRIYVNGTYDTFSTFGGDWHGEVSHMAETDANAAAILFAAYQRYFASGLLDLVTKLDTADNGTGGSLLDNSLVVWTHESGNYTHASTSVPMITFGSAGGALRTGQYVDYRNLAKYMDYSAYWQNEGRWHGLLMHQWCGTVLQAMGIPKSEYENLAVNGGYPDFNYDYSPGWNRYPGSEAPYTTAVWNAATQMLPWLGA